MEDQTSVTGAGSSAGPGLLTAAILFVACGRTEGSEPAECTLREPCNAVLCSPEVATVNRIATRADEAFGTADASYGQVACPDQFVYEVPAELVMAACSDMNRCQAAVAGLWTVLGLDVDQCADVIANTTVFVLGDEWHCVESIRFVGVPLGAGTCYARALSRTLPIPRAAKDDEFYEFVHVPLRNLTSPALPEAIPEVRAVRVAVRAFNEARNVKLPVSVSVDAVEP